VRKRIEGGKERGRKRKREFFLSLYPCRKRNTSRRWRRSWICRWTSCLHSSTRSHSRSHSLSRMDCSTTFYPSSTRSFSLHTSPNTCNSSSISISATTQVGSLISRSFFSKAQFSFSPPSIISLTLSPLTVLPFHLQFYSQRKRRISWDISSTSSWIGRCTRRRDCVRCSILPASSHADRLSTRP
jgi:hypothetical protein